MGHPAKKLDDRVLESRKKFTRIGDKVFRLHSGADAADDYDGESLYYAQPSQESDKRKKVFGEDAIVKENGSEWKRDYPQDADLQIKAEQNIDARRDTVYSDRAKFIEMVREKLKHIPNSIRKMKENYDKPLDVPTNDSAAGRTITQMAAVEAGHSPTKTLRNAHIEYLLGEADKAGVHSPRWKEKFKNKARDYLLNKPRAAISPAYKRNQNIENQKAFNSLKKGDQVVLYFGGLEHKSMREGLQKKGTKYISPMKDGIFGAGPGYHVGLDKRAGAESVKEWADKIYKATGKKPRVVGYGEKGSKHVFGAITEHDLNKIADTNVVGAVEKDPNERASGYVNIFGTGTKRQRAAYHPKGKHNVMIKNATGLDLAYGRANEVIKVLQSPKYSKK